MTTASTRRAAVAAVVVAVVLALATTAVAAAAAVTGSRVAAHDQPAPTVVAASEHVLAGQGRAATTWAAKEVVGSRVAPQTTRALDLPDPYLGVREASQYLRNAGVPRSVRKEVLESFERGTIRVEQAGADTFGLRYFGDGSDALGRYVFPTFPAGQSSLALPPGNLMTGIAQFQIRPGATFFSGRAGPNFGYPGGGQQYFVPNLDCR